MAHPPKKHRGSAKCEALYKRKKDGHPPMQLQWRHRRPFAGPHVGVFPSLVGFEARSRARIDITMWPLVPKDVKDTILAEIQTIYEIPKEGINYTLKLAGERWRAFKVKLRKDFLKPGGKRRGEHPNYYYNFVTREHWENFKNYYTSDNMKAISAANTERQQKNVYPHNMGRGGYRMLEQKILSSSSTTTTENNSSVPPDLSRENMWLLGRTKDNQIPNPNVREVAERIVKLKADAQAGTFTPVGHDDILTRALGTSEHPGRTRGVGSLVGLRNVFKGKKKSQKSDGMFMTQDELEQFRKSVLNDAFTMYTQRLPQLLQSLGVQVSGSIENIANISQQFPMSTPQFQQSSKASVDPDPFADLTEVDIFKLGFGKGGEWTGRVYGGG
ncbi:unnamed protein product [Cuscuta campestris]|uniref:Transposase, Ptta/En/Spm, plant n=1 Tax=Cuscuta campestris TaxID=132261 RepID=A0A484LQE2_9ASTE|nr:unnamed protein product [Cuscuta campestris]